jgi:SAM-dependent methyltransferase
VSVYNRFVLPWVLHLSCASPPIAKQRQKVLPKARGVVLEVGMGTGLNLPFYAADQIDRIYGLEPAQEMVKRAKLVAKAMPFDVEFIALPGEQIPLEDHSIDTVVLTYTLCTIGDPTTALAGMKRVLKPDGVLLFCEHGRAPDARVARCQDRLNGVWSACAGGCNLNRNIPELIEKAGFQLVDLQTGYLAGTPKFAGFNYWGEGRV